MAPQQLAIVGNLTKDQLYFVDRFPAIDDVSTVRRSVRCFGGRGAAVSVILAKALGARLITTLPTACRPGALEFLNASGDDASGIQWCDSDAALSEVLVTIGREEQNCTSLFVPGFVTDVVTREQRSQIESADLMYVTTHSIPFNQEAVKFARDRCVLIANITSYMFAECAYRSDMLHRAQVLIGNRDEWKLLLRQTGCSSPAGLFDRFPQLRHVYRTLGAEGAEAFVPDGSRIHRKSEAGAAMLTPVGVGDAFAAGVVAAEFLDRGPAEALSWGTALARLSLEAPETCIRPGAAEEFFARTL